MSVNIHNQFKRSPQIKLEIATNINEITISEEKWSQLIDNNETNTIFQTYQWFQSWWQVFGKENELFFYTAFDAL